MEDLIKKIEDKYRGMKQDPEAYLAGLYHAKPITYWDYVEVETLLSLQRPRTNFADEEIFIMYHQITELMLKLMRHEINQITENENISIELFKEKIERVNRYTGLMANSFSIMSEGMNYDDFNQFRLTLTPASGFQSAQFRFVELACTDIENLVNRDTKGKIPANADLNYIFDHLYWKEAGINPTTGEKSLTLSLFEEKYQAELMEYALHMKDRNIMKRFEKLDPSLPGYEDLKNTLKKFDRFYNIKWTLVHLEAANAYLNKKGENKRATGSSNWQKYLHPAFQQRKFFPSLLSQEEIDNWAKEYL